MRRVARAVVVLGLAAGLAALARALLARPEAPPSLDRWPPVPRKPPAPTPPAA